MDLKRRRTYGGGDRFEEENEEEETMVMEEEDEMVVYFFLKKKLSLRERASCSARVSFNMKVKGVTVQRVNVQDFKVQEQFVQHADISAIYPKINLDFDIVKNTNISDKMGISPAQ